MGRTPFYQTSNTLKRVHLLVIELRHPIFSLEWLNIKLQHSSTHYQQSGFGTNPTNHLGYIGQDVP